ncbi:MAG: glycoside hydrolase family 2 TIM barrel-domain containing protein [Rikenellaceae bacterium]
MILRSLKIVLALIILCLPAGAQNILRSEFVPYQLRKDAEARSRTAEDSIIEFNPKAVATAFGMIRREQVIDVPQSWSDVVAMIHIEPTGSAYTLSVNDRKVVECEDGRSPRQYDISSYLALGENLIALTTRNSALAQLEEGLDQLQQAPLTGSYIYTQRRLRILDYDLTLEELDNGIDAQLFIDVIVENRFNFPETIEIGFDLYDPAGKLLDFSTAQSTIEGNSVDTIRFKPYLYGASKYRWDPSSPSSMRVIGGANRRYADQMLYSVMLFTKNDGSSSDYIPFSVGFSLPKYEDGALRAWDRKIDLSATSYNALGDKKQTETELRAIRQKGYNTVEPSYPQPIWFYELCDKIGLYVIEQAAINAPTAADDKRIGGTPSNDPALAREYLSRLQAAYYRTRNFTCIVAYSLGSPSGNGYNMYKAYEWLKSVETRRPVIYKGAAGEWNSDPLTIEY